MNLLFVLSHPGHYYLFKNLSSELSKIGHNTLFAIRGKDVLEEILIAENIEYEKLCNEFYRGNSRLSIVAGAVSEMLYQDYRLFKLTKKFKPDLLLGTDISISHVGKVLGIPSFIFNEDDYEINKLFCKATYPFANHIVSPQNCNVGKYLEKKISYDGYQKLAYLHPKYFTPDKKIIKNLKSPYYLIRVVNLKAIHDIEGEHNGLDLKILQRIIKKLKKTGNVYLNSEGNLFPELNEYSLKVKVNEIHHVIANADLFIGDSQTMSAEAGLLGTPFIRFNDFVGKITYLNDMENKYNLGFGVKSSDTNSLFDKIDLIINNNLKKNHIKKSLALFNDKINVTEFWTWLIDSYPKSIKVISSNPDFQNEFK
tara:strand:- start:450 stop:1553 length:1104 start_codon:yes stop_codon:yes gene_type:complete